MAALPLQPVTREPSELHTRTILSAIPSGASETVTINLPPGLYVLRVTGSQTAATTDPTLLVERYMDEAQSIVGPIYGEDIDTTSPIKTAIDLEVANVYVDLWFSPTNMAASTNPSLAAAWVPYGLKFTYTKNGATVTAIHLAALRLG